MAAYNLGVQYGKLNKMDEAIRNYSIALTFNSKDKLSYMNRANALAQKQRFKEALSDYSAALALDPNDGSIYYNRALTNYNAGNYDACMPDLKKAIELKFPADPEFLKMIAAYERRKTIRSNY
jgi:tetratricopeptide (TPR) repeat protein